jgi:hypothetical protein
MKPTLLDSRPRKEEDIGAPTVARKLAEPAMRNNIDGLQFVLPDYLADLPRLAGEVLPAVTEQVVEARAVGTS